MSVHVVIYFIWSSPTLFSNCIKVLAIPFYSFLLLCKYLLFSVFHSILIQFMIHHSISSDVSNERHFCCLSYYILHYWFHIRIHIKALVWSWLHSILESLVFDISLVMSRQLHSVYIRSEAFTASEWNEIFSDDQPSQYEINFGQKFSMLSHLPHACYVPHPSHLLRFDLSRNSLSGVK